ncbi:MAG: VCBS repeat-containing protein [Bryobacterales bacterium]|nr:VCBS repeat-containing protein [Bryobacterales bacterium]
MASGPAGSTYIAGIAAGRRHGQRLYVTRLDAAGLRRDFTGYLTGQDHANVKAIAVDREGSVYLTGHTPAARSFVAKLDAKGNRIWSTVLEEAVLTHAIAVDALGDVYVTGDGSLVKLRDGRTLASAKFSGTARAIALSADLDLYLAGQDGTGAFLARFDSRLRPVWNRTLAGRGEQAATSVALTESGHLWVTGWTTSADFPNTTSVNHAGARDIFLAGFDTDGTRRSSRLLGGRNDDTATAMLADRQGNLYLAGTSASTDFVSEGSGTAFVLKLGEDGERTYAAERLEAAGDLPLAVDALGNATLASSRGLHRLSTCRYSLSKSLQNFAPSGGESTAQLTTSPECGWYPESSVPWITVARVDDRIEFLAAPNAGAPRAATVVAGGQTLIVVQSGKAAANRDAITGPIRANAGFRTSTIAACDDCSANAVAPLGFSINFYGSTYTQVYVNNNGNVTFDSSNSTFTPNPISSIRRVLIAAFWADVDTRGTGSGLTTYGQDVINGRRAFGVNWVDVGYYASKTNKLNSMQLVLLERADLGAGFFDIELNYSGIQWETGDASGGSNGLGGTPARVGFSNGSGNAGTFFELPGSGAPGAFLDGGANSLSFNSANSGGVAGRYVYNVRPGAVVCGTGINNTFASVTAAGGNVPVAVTASNASCTWGVSGLPTWISTSNAPPGFGTGSGTASLVVQANTGPSRNATFSVAGQNFTVSQAGTTGTITCPPVSFSRGGDASMMAGTTNQGTISGVERNADGSLTQHAFTGTQSNYTQSSSPNFQQTFTSCTGRTPGATSPPINYRLLAEQRGIAARNPIFTDLTGTGRSTAVGVNPYSQDPSRLQVWNSDANRQPGTKFNYDIPANPQKLIAADFNNDGKQDIVLISQGVTGSNQGILSIFLGNGNGTLGARRDYNVGNNPQSASAFDFNSDGKLDLAVTNAGSGTLSILNGNGDGTFSAPFTVASTSRAPGDATGHRGVTVADVNRDGKSDLLIAHNDGVDLRLGTGTGTFQTPTRVIAGFLAGFIGTGDLNKDSNPDIVVSSEATSTLTVLTGNGNGTFSPPNTYVTRDHANSFFVTDFDWDGNPDVVFGAGHPDALVAAAGDTNITVFYGRGNGTLFGPPGIFLPSLGSFTTGDFNGDSIPDVAATVPLVTGAANTSSVYVALNTGTGALTPQTPISLNSLALNRITSADFNADGKRDIAATSGTSILAALGTGTGGFGTPTSLTTGSSVTSLTTADLNADSRPDLIFTDDAEDRVSVALGNGNGSFQARTPLTVGVDPKDVAAADINADGRIDLIVANQGSPGTNNGSLSLLLGNGNGTFSNATGIASSFNPTNITIGDVNADGRPDLIVSTSGANATTYIAVHLNSGNAVFATPTLLPVAFGPAKTALTDFNADGKVDIVVGHCCGEVQMGVLLGNGNGTFAAESLIPNTGFGSSYVFAADMNNDAKTDVVFGANGVSGQGAFAGVLLNSTGGTGPLPCTFTVSQSSYGPTAAAQSFGGTLSASAASCAFTAQSNATWATVTPASGTGSSPFSITVEANNGAARTATITIGGQSIIVTQGAPACPFTFNPGSISTLTPGGAFTIGVTTNPGCAWSLTGLPAWVTVQSPTNLNGTGPANIALTIAANAGLARIANLAIGGQPFVVAQSGIAPAGGMRFVPLPPCRVMETRTLYNSEGRTGAFGPPTLNAAETRTLVMPSSNVCNIPTTAKAYVVNVTVVPAGGGVNFATLWPAGEARPNTWTIRSPDGQTVANSSIVKAGTNGGISVYVSDRTDLLIDISGYYTDVPIATGLVYYPLTPCRVIDTRSVYRSPAGPFGPPSMNAQETRRFRFPATPYCTVPNAVAYSVTLTVVPPAPLAFLTAWPAGLSQPGVSSINSFVGRVLANSVVIPASADGAIDVFVYNNSDVLMDINGYFAPDDGQNGLYYFPVTQCRASDSTVSGGQYADESTRTLNIPSAAGCSGIPGSARAYAINVTALPAGNPMPFLTAYPTGQPRPGASILNAFEGQTVTNAAIVPSGLNGSIDIFAYRRTNVVLEVSGYFGR